MKCHTLSSSGFTRMKNPTFPFQSRYSLSGITLPKYRLVMIALLSNLSDADRLLHVSVTANAVMASATFISMCLSSEKANHRELDQPRNADACWNG